MKYVRLAKAIIRGVGRSYSVWQMNEVKLAGKELYSCVSCGMARSEPCEHWQNTIDDYAATPNGDSLEENA